MVTVTRLSNPVKEDIKSGFWLVCVRVPERTTNWPHWNAIYCKHHFGKRMMTKGACLNSKWAKITTPQQYRNYIRDLNSKDNPFISRKGDLGTNSIKETMAESGACDFLKDSSSDWTLSEPEECAEIERINFKDLRLFLDKKTKFYKLLMKKTNLSIINSCFEDELEEETKDIMEYNFEKEDSKNASLCKSQYIPPPKMPKETKKMVIIPPPIRKMFGILQIKKYNLLFLKLPFIALISIIIYKRRKSIQSPRTPASPFSGMKRNSSTGDASTNVSLASRSQTCSRSQVTVSPFPGQKIGGKVNQKIIEEALEENPRSEEENYIHNISNSRMKRVKMEKEDSEENLSDVQEYSVTSYLIPSLLLQFFTKEISKC